MNRDTSIWRMLPRLVVLFMLPFILILGGAVARHLLANRRVPAAAVVAAPAGPADWMPPEWLPWEEGFALDGMAADGPSTGPVVRSRAVFVYDIDAGEVRYARRADERQPVASLTKLVAGLAFVSADGDLERKVCIGAEQYPTRSGARSRLSTGDCTTGGDLLGAALTASDNRAAYGLAAAADMGVDDFIGQMNRVAEQLGMVNSTFADPSGLEDDNLSTARDMARATVAVAAVPALSNAATAPSWMLSRSTTGPRQLFSTNRLIASKDLEFLAAKTGYTDTAQYCFSAVVRTSEGQRLVMTFLGARGKRTRWADARRVLDWVEQDNRRRAVLETETTGRLR
ncbi:MAG: serine hydrolase [Myxococcota bacterium]